MGALREPKGAGKSPPGILRGKDCSTAFALFYADFSKEILHRYEYLGKQLDEERENHQRERDWSRGAIVREKALSDELHKYNSLMV